MVGPRREARGPSDRDSILRPPDLGEETGVRIRLVKGRCYRQTIREAKDLKDDVGMSMEAEELNMKFDDVTGQYVLHMREIRPEFYKFLIGAKGAMLQKLERETGCSIVVPKTTSQQEENGVVVRGLSEESVLGAKNRVEFIVESSREKIPYTHFVSIPLDMPSLAPRVEEVVERLRSSHCTSENRLEPEMIQRPEKLHLTVAMLRLYGKEDEAKAAATLRKCAEVLKGLFSADDKVGLYGVDCMNDDPTQVNVAYFKVQPGAGHDKLLQLVDAVSREFIVAGLCSSKEAESSRLLHATIINSKWRRSSAAAAEDDEDESLVTRKEARVPFDMTGVFEEFGEHDLGQHKLMRLEVSVMQDKGETGYFDALASIPFP